MKKILFLITIIPILLLGQQNNKKVYSLEECINIALKQSYLLKASEARLQNTESKFYEAKTNSLPSLKFIGSYSRLSDIDPFQVTLPAPISKTMTISPVLLDNTNLRLNLQQPEPFWKGTRLRPRSPPRRWPTWRKPFRRWPTARRHLAAECPSG